jgi:hypothetical protein
MTRPKWLDDRDDPPHTLGYPLTVESTDIDGRWMLVNIDKYIGGGKYAGCDEDGEDIVVDYKTLGKVTWSHPRVFDEEI